MIKNYLRDIMAIAGLAIIGTAFFCTLIALAVWFLPWSYLAIFSVLVVVSQTVYAWYLDEILAKLGYKFRTDI